MRPKINHLNVLILTDFLCLSIDIELQPRDKWSGKLPSFCFWTDNSKVFSWSDICNFKWYLHACQSMGMFHLYPFPYKMIKDSVDD